MSRFDERAKEWDTPERRKGAEAVADAIRSAVPLTRSMRAIDIGAGTGLLGLTLAREVGEMVLAEQSGGMLEVVREKLAAGAAANASAIAFDLVVDPAPAKPFDLAVSSLVLHHVADTEAALRAIHNLLVPGGRLALADLDAESGTFHEPGAEGIYHPGFDRKQLMALARVVGFIDVETRTATELERNGRSYPLFLLLARRRP